MTKKHRSYCSSSYDCIEKLVVNRKLINCGPTFLNGPVNIDNDLNVTGNITVEGALEVCNIRAGAECSNVTVSSPLILNGDVTFNGDATFNGLLNNVAPAVITVNPALPPDGITVFNTIQSAIDSLHGKTILSTQINVAPGTYVENLVFRSLLVTDLNNFVIQGDTRLVAGAGIAHGMYWNNVTTPAVGVNAPLGGGFTSEAVLTGVTGGNTISVTTLVPSATSANPNFTLPGGVEAGLDRVAVRHTNGTFAIYNVTAVAPTVLTVSPNLLGDVNDLGAAISILPRVELAPGVGAPIIWETRATLLGFTVTIPMNIDAGLVIRGASRCNHGRCLWYGGAVSNRSNEAYTTVSTVTSVGSTFFNCTLEVYRGGNSQIATSNSLLAPASGGRGLNLTENVWYLIPATRFIGNNVLLLANNSRGTTNAANRSVEFLYTGTGDAITLAEDANLQIITGTPFRLRGSALNGINMSGSFLTMETGSTYIPSSSNPNFTAINVGGPVVNAPVQSSNAYVNFGTITIPASGSAFIAKVLNDSTLTVGSVGTTNIGANSNGVLVSNSSELIWNAGNVTGSAISVTGTLFNVDNNSTVLMTSAAAKIFRNYPTLFNIDDSSNANIDNTNTQLFTGTHYRVNNLSDLILKNSVLNGGDASVTLTNGSRLRSVNNTFNGPAPTADATSIIIA